MSINEQTITAEQFLASKPGTKSDPAIRFAADPRTGLRLKSGGVLALVANGGDVLAVTAPAGTVNGLDVLGAAAGNPVVLAAAGRDTDVSLLLRPQGNGVLRVDAAGYAGRLAHPNDIPNKKYIDDRLAATTAVASLRSSEGAILVGDTVADSVNHLRVTPAAGGQPPVIRAAGSDAHIDLVLAGQGDGLVQAPAGYRMDGGPAEAFVTKGYADAQAAPPGLTLRTLTGADGWESEPVLFQADPIRSKLLSLEQTVLAFTRRAVSPGSWLGCGDLSHAEAGVALPYDATIVRATATTADAAGSSRVFSVWVNGAEVPAVIALGGDGSQRAANTAVNIDVPAGSKIRVQAQDGAGAAFADTCVTLWVKWRYVG